MTEPQEPEFRLVMPFVVCESNGGPYADEPFVAGATFGKIEAECRTILGGRQKRWYVPSALVPQLDLLAMDQGLTMTAEPWDEHPDEWTLVTMSGAERERSDECSTGFHDDCRVSDVCGCVCHGDEFAR